jgi:hypothetical protein
MKKLICALLFLLVLSPLGASVDESTYVENETSWIEYSQSQSWRCPYCRQICEIGHSCKNPHCPSKYPDMT